MSSLTQVNWFVLIGVFAATVLIHALLTLALSRATERWGARKAVSEVALHGRKVVGQGGGRTGVRHAAGVAVEANGAGGHRHRSRRLTLDGKVEPPRERPVARLVRLAVATARRLCTTLPAIGIVGSLTGTLHVDGSGRQPGRSRTAAGTRLSLDGIHTIRVAFHM
jgi:hypothetical protein